MLNRLSLKKDLLATIAEQKTQRRIAQDAPVTDTQLDSTGIEAIETLTTALEQQNPFPRPLFYSPNLLQGAWQLHYSNAREIRSLNRLPFCFRLGQVYQVIDVPSGTFFNQAFCYQPMQGIAGHVIVTAEFQVAPSEGDGLPDQRLNVFFKKRSLYIDRLLGFKTPSSQPFKTFDARNPEGRTPYLKVTYIDENLRIGRGGEGSLFILSRSEQGVQP